MNMIMTKEDQDWYDKAFSQTDGITIKANKVYNLHPDTSVVMGKRTQAEYEQSRLEMVKKFVITLVCDMRFTEDQVRIMIEDCLDGKYSGASLEFK